MVFPDISSFSFLQHPFIKGSKPNSILSNMLADAARIREDELDRDQEEGVPGENDEVLR